MWLDLGWVWAARCNAAGAAVARALRCMGADIARVVVLHRNAARMLGMGSSIAWALVLHGAGVAWAPALSGWQRCMGASFAWTAALHGWQQRKSAGVSTDTSTAR